jgi:large conductance mechanosensitive channel
MPIATTVPTLLATEGPMLQEFKRFVLRGNVVDLAVAVVIGAAFTSVVNALVKDLITPLLAAIGGKPDFSSLVFTVNGSVFRYGDFLNALITFVILAAVVFFLVVKPLNYLLARSRQQPPADPTTQKCPECLSEIPLAARRCAFCTVELSVPRAGLGQTLPTEHPI